MPGHEGAVPGSATIGGVSRGSVALVLSLRIFFVKYLLSSWYCGLRCACARSCVAPASGLWFLGASLPSTGFVVAMQIWYCPVLLA